MRSSFMRNLGLENDQVEVTPEVEQPISLNEGETTVNVTGPLADTYRAALDTALAKTEEDRAAGTETVATDAPVVEQVAREVAGEVADQRGDVTVNAVTPEDITPETAIEMTAEAAKNDSDEYIAVIDATGAGDEVVSPDQVEVVEVSAGEEAPAEAPAEGEEAPAEGEVAADPLEGLSPAVESYVHTMVAMGARVMIARRK